MSERRTRQRSVPHEGGSITGESWTSFQGYPGRYSESSGTLTADGTQVTESEGNQVSLLGKTDADVGSNFKTVKSTVESHGQQADCDSVSTFPGFHYRGRALAVSPSPTYFAPDLSSSEAEMMALGSTAISRCSPVDSHAELLTALAEAAREGMPSLPGSQQWESKTRIARGAGSEYLNAQFGWVPLVSEVNNLATSVRKSEKILRQFERDNGRNVRRTYDFPLEESTEVILDEEANNLGVPTTPSYLPSQLFDGYQVSGRLVLERTIKRKRWFAGCFVYHVPTGADRLSSVHRAVAEYDLLYGVAPTPDVLWNLTPWSWAMDWFGNVGDVINNVSNRMLYGQVLRYGYMMETTTVMDKYTRYTPHFRGGAVFTTSFKTETKQRVKASPFGFGLTWDGFDAYQLSILAALGITRGRRA
jgi:hypothetical protein